MKIQEEIAIIGASFKLPDCENWNELLSCLRTANDCVGPIPDLRLQGLGAHRNGNEKQAGWLEDISSFDYRKFGISYSEAQLIDPRQRQSLQLVYHAILDAGYSLESFSSTRTAVLTSAAGGPNTDFYSILTPSDKLDPQAFTGNLHALSAGRIAYYFNFNGPAFTVDTGCSSFLSALHQACLGLKVGEYEVAIVGGCELVVGEVPLKEQGNGRLGVESSTDRSRPFDSESDGAGFGEGGGFVILKRKCDAERYGDNILAVICGSAMNHDGARCNGITSPSAHAQSEVINQALQFAHLKPQQVSYIEAHGTGTKIGDPIEIEGLLNSHLTDRPNGEHCYVSSTKSNFGHLGGMAGFAGLIRILAQFRVGELFPTVHFKNLNPLAEQNFTKVFSICNENQPWLPVDGERIAGISSFGLSGTNVHCILKAPTPRNSEVVNTGEKMFVLSDNSEQGLHALKQALLSTLQSHQFSLNDISSTLLAGREHLKYRWSCVADTQEELIAALQLEQKPNHNLLRQVVLCFDCSTTADAAMISQIIDNYTAAAQFIEDHYIDIDALTSMQRQLIWMFLNQKLTQALKLPINTVLTTGLGKLVNAVNSQSMTLAEALVAANDCLSDDTVNKERLQEFISSVPDAAFISMDINSRLAQLLKAKGLMLHEVSSLEPLLLELFNSGGELNWAALAAKKFNRLALPYPALIKRDCWPSTINSAHQENTITSTNEETLITDACDKYQQVLSIVCCVLKDDSVCIDDDFFTIGGNSLNGIKVIDGINEVFGSELTLEDLLYSDNLASLADLLDEPVIQSPVTPTTDDMLTDNVQLTGQQEMIWAASELQNIEGTYHIPAAMISDKQIDHQWLTKLVNDLVKHQSALRSKITHGDNGVQMSTVSPFEVQIAHTSIDLSEYDFLADRAKLEQYLQQKMAEPLDIYSEQNFSVQLFDANFSDGRRSVMLFVFHHLFFDGWSWKVIFEALTQGLVPVPQRSLSAYLSEQTLKATKAYHFWTEYLQGLSQPSIRLSYADYVKDGGLDSAYELSGDYIAFQIDSMLTASVAQFAKLHRATNYTVLLSTWILFHWLKTGQRKVCVAIPVANRKPEDELTIGCFINTVVGAYDIDVSLTLAQVIKTVSESTMKAVSNAACPTNKIYECGALQSDSLVMFDYQFDFSKQFELAQGQTVELLDVEPMGAKHPINVTCIESDGAIEMRFEYSTQWFSKETMHTFVDEFLVLLMDVVSAQPDTEILTLFDERSTDSLDVDDAQFDF